MASLSSLFAKEAPDPAEGELEPDQATWTPDFAKIANNDRQPWTLQRKRRLMVRKSKTRNPPMRRLCGLLGATGVVGQKFMLLLENHPNFKLVAIAASAAGKGLRYDEHCAWKQEEPMPEYVRSMRLGTCDPRHFVDLDATIIFSALDSKVAGDIEKKFVGNGFAVFSNAASHRYDPYVPLIVPTANIPHLELCKKQQEQWGVEEGFLVCNSNCAVTGIAVPLAQLIDQLGHLSDVSVVTMQSVSGAGYPGVSAMDILGNVIPYIEGEEEKIEKELVKILDIGKTHPLRVSAHCNRVPVLYGHTACISIKFDQRPAPPLEFVEKCLSSFSSPASLRGCPSAPGKTTVHTKGKDRPQPRVDKDSLGGYGVAVGRIREDESGMFDYKFVTVINNTTIGAAGSSILNAEAATLRGMC